MLKSHLPFVSLFLLIGLGNCVPTRTYLASLPAKEDLGKTEKNALRLLLVGQTALIADSLQADLHDYWQKALQDPHQHLIALGNALPAAWIDSLARQHPGQVWGIPGQKETKSFLPQPSWVLPQRDCPGPEEILLHEQLVLIFINTPWWFAQENQAPENTACEIRDEEGFLSALRDVLSRHQHRQVIILGHHPLVSNGKIGGHFPWTQHLWPLPGLGTLGWAYRKTLGLSQDQAYPRYRQLQKSLKTLFSEHSRLIYACGYEGSLQYHPMGQWHHFQSGSWGKKSFLVKKNGAHLATNQPGSIQLVFPEKEAAYWQAYIGHQPTYQGSLFNVSVPPSDSIVPLPDYQGKTITRPLNPAYAAVSRYRRWTLGHNYRREWATPVTFPYFDWGADLGGLHIIKKGGGQATNSLRLEAPDGRQYVLRSVDKQGDKALPDVLKNTFVADIVQDQTSAAHPYAPLVVPRLAEAAGLSHARPRYVYLAPDPRLKGYEALADDVYLFEERPDDTFWRDVAHFGKARDIKSTAKVLEKLQSDNDERIDQRAVVKYRLFDIWLGDWDRHDDQWRWGQYEDKNTKQKIYRPIPRDRDQVFFNSDGKLVDLASHEWGLPKFQGFKARIRSIRGYNFNARYFDRFFLTEPSSEDWQAAARELQAALTDSLIDRALADLPAEVQFRNAEIAAKLRQRRQDLPIYAEAYFQFLSKAVSITGSDKHELFEITHQAPAQTRVEVYKIKKGESKKRTLLYQRTFEYPRTREIRLYGLDGEDVFLVRGQSPKGVKVRIIGGPGQDQVIDSSRVQKGAKKTWVYDQPAHISIQEGPETRPHLSRQEVVNRYDRYDYRYPYLGPVVFLGFNVDDGLFLGGGLKIRTPGFRKDPFQSQHIVKANYALATNSYNFNYEGEWTGVLGKGDLLLQADVRAPNYVQNFFGLGNETRNETDTRRITYYRVRYQQYQLSAQWQRTWQEGRLRLRLGLFTQGVEVENNEGRFITNFSENGLDPQNLLETFKGFGGGQISLTYDGRNETLLPRRGLRFSLEGRYVKGFEDNASSDINFWQWKGEVAIYPSLSPALTLALRAGGAHTWGDFDFFQANTLGGNENLRGYRNYRFAGRSSFFQNSELRWRLFPIRSFLFNGYFGLLGIHDVGRVWQPGENSNRWHQGYGGGIWFTPAQALVVSATYTTSRDDSVFFVRFGFLF